MNNIGTAYVLWLGCLLQLHGLHRLYNGKIFTGLLWMFSFGLFGIGQLVDLLLIPNMVQEHNDKLRSSQGLLPSGVPQDQAVIERVVIQEDLLPPVVQSQTNQLTVKLLRAAEARGGKLSVTQGVMETGASFAEVENVLLSIVRAGYADIGNHPETGVVLYEFKEL
ncbi:MAG: NINE protein [Leptolyngbyaceae cyanobacterium HOT.MB2.61]|jgi:TM2 domain.|nr:NINE protein [Leptolyngbyaceae cyanobacterium HOT.MB2.61]